MKSYPTAYRGEGESASSPFLDSEQWEWEYLKGRTPFPESNDLLPAGEKVGNPGYEEETTEGDAPCKGCGGCRELFPDESETEDPSEEESQEYESEDQWAESLTQEEELDREDLSEDFDDPEIDGETFGEAGTTEWEDEDFQLHEFASVPVQADLETVAQSVFEDQLYSDFDQEVLIENAVPPTVPNIKSCNPSRHQHGKLHVVRWKDRYRPCDRRVPSRLRLAILSRARTRVPLRVVTWLIRDIKHKSKDSAAWVFRIPKKFSHSNVDLTIELFYMRELLTNSEVEEILGQYLTLRHSKEKGPHCDRGFFLFETAEANAHGKAWVEKHFGLGTRGLNLDKLYQQGGVSPHGQRCKGGRPDETTDAFVLLCYITLPNEFEHELKPVPPPPPKPPTPKETRRQLAKAVLEVVKTYVPKDKDVFRRKHMECLLRIVTDHLVDGERIVDITVYPADLRSHENPKGHFIKDMEIAWRDSKGNHETFWRKLNTQYRKMDRFLDTLIRRSNKDRIELPPSSWYKASENFRALCHLRTRSQKSYDIVHCFQRRLDDHQKNERGEDVCP